MAQIPVTGAAEAAGFDTERLTLLARVVEADIAANRYDGARILVGRGGKLVFDGTFGYKHREREIPLKPDDVFVLMSISKAMTAITVLQAIERGDLMFTTRVAEIIPEFAQGGKQRVTIANVMSHTASLPAKVDIAPEKVGDLAAMVAAVCAIGIDHAPGTRIDYSTYGSSALLAEIVRRIDGGKRRFAEIIDERLFKQLGMRDTALGDRPHLHERRVPMIVRDRSPSILPAASLEAFDRLLVEASEIPAAGVLSTGADMMRFAEALRRGGELDGKRIVGPLTLQFAAQNHTGTMSNNMVGIPRETLGLGEWPGNMGLGFITRGTGIFPQPIGTLTSPRTFGATGIGSTTIWIDPERDVTFVALTSGMMEQLNSWLRFQKLSDVALAALVKP